MTNMARKSFFRILPVRVRGRASTKATLRGRFIPGQFPSTVIDNFILGHVNAGSFDDNGHTHFAPFFIRDADNTGVGHGRVTHEHVFDFGRVYVFAAADVHIFPPVDQVQVAFFIKVPHVAGMQPAIDNGFGRGIGAAASIH